MTPGVDTSGLQLDGISCPSENLCVAVDLGGNVVTSTNPTGGASAWKTKSGIEAPPGFSKISCPTTTLCVAVTLGGNIDTSTDPADGVNAVWNRVTVGGNLTGVSCASASTCVVVGSAFMAPGGVIYATIDPTTTVATDWKSTAVSSAVQGVSCPSPTLCVAFENQTSSGTSASVIASTNPTGASPGWTAPATIDPGHTIAGLSCSSPSLCVAVDSGGSTLTTTEPTGGAAAWNASTVIGGNNAFSAVSCAAGPFCVATTSTTTPSQFWVSVNPTGGAFAWQQANLAVPIYAVSCPSTGLCVAVDDIGNVLTTTNPNSSSPSVSVTQVTGPTLLSIACPTSALCVATDSAGDVVTSVSPTGGASGWTSSNVDGSEAILAVSCPTTTFCAAADDAGDVLTSTNPAGGAGAWSSMNVDGDASVAGISCSSPSFCVAVDDLGDVLVSTNPTGGAGAWRATRADPGNFLFAVSCVSDALCVAVDLAGNVVTSTAPASAAPGWTSANVDDSPLTAVSCSSITMCVAVDGSGFEINSINPSGGADEWTGTSINEGPLFGVSCPDTSGCAVVDGNGDAAWGGSTPSNLTLPSITGQATQGSQLIEVHGTWTPSPTNYSMQWERCNAAGASCSDISGATGSSYTLTSADVGSTIRALELASNANGDGATVESPQTAVVQASPAGSSGAPGPPAIPSGGVGAATIKGTSTSGTNVKILLSCTGPAGATCPVGLTLTVKETIKRGKVIAVAATAKLKKKVVVVGTTTVTLGAGQSKTVTVSLNAVGKRLLAKSHTLKVKLAITESTNTVFSTTITIRSQVKKKH